MILDLEDAVPTKKTEAREAVALPELAGVFSSRKPRARMRSPK